MGEENMRILKWVLSKEKIRSVPDLRPSFLLYHNGGEVWISCIDNLGDDMKLIKEKIYNNELSLMIPNKHYRVLYHLDGTEVTYDVAEYMMDSLVRSRKNIIKIAIVGTTRKGKYIIERCMNNAAVGQSLGINYFSSMDQAKDWLISEKF
jgi:hypothetical protein